MRDQRISKSMSSIFLALINVCIFIAPVCNIYKNLVLQNYNMHSESNPL